MSKKLIQAAAGAGGESVYVEDVFSTYLYSGQTSSLEINNGLDLDGEGGLVWIKARTDAASHSLFDTERTLSTRLISNSTNTEQLLSGNFTSFDSDGFTLAGNTGALNDPLHDYVSWSLRKQAGFFDVVTYTGDGTASRDIAHNLGSKPGFILTKRLNLSGNWTGYHQSLGYTKRIYLDVTNAASTNAVTWVQEPTATHFTVGSENTSGSTYVAYLFAHDDQSFGDNSDESIIKCGSFTADGSGAASVNLGWEPQWVLHKTSSTSGSWGITDIMRGMPATGSNTSQRLEPHTSLAEETRTTRYTNINSTGFNVDAPANSTSIYIAIRRPMKTPEAGTEVFNPIATTTTTPTTSYTVGFPADFLLQGYRTYGISPRTTTRLIGSSNYLETASTASEATGFGSEWDLQDDYAQAAGISTGVISWFFKRATGFFDVVAYEGTGVARTVNHNLGVVPELMILKVRDRAGSSWVGYHKDLGNEGGFSLDSFAAFSGVTSAWNSTTPTSSVFTVGTGSNYNGSGDNLIAYLFATLAGVSKVGSYTGTGTTNNIDCGFSSSARFVMVKRTSSTGDWYVWDSARGITVGSDPFLKTNTTDAEGTTSDIIQPYSSGFTLTSNAGAAINGSGSSFIFLAIA